MMIMLSRKSVKIKKLHTLLIGKMWKKLIGVKIVKNKNERKIKYLTKGTKQRSDDEQIWLKVVLDDSNGITPG